MLEQLLSNIQSFNLGYTSWLALMLCGALYGMSKGGIKGIGSLAVPVMAYIFGGKASTGLVLPMLIMADILAVPYYNRYANWVQLFKLLPWAMVGVILGVWIGDLLPESLFRKTMAFLVILCVILLFWWDKKKNKYVPSQWWFAALLGIGAGFTTMVGNVAGPVVTLYLFSMRLPKLDFIGTAAWFFFIINLFKVPMHIFFWETINWKSLSLSFAVFPAIAIGFSLGVFLLKRLAEQNFRKMILFLTALAAILLLFR